MSNDGIQQEKILYSNKHWMCIYLNHMIFKKQDCKVAYYFYFNACDLFSHVIDVTTIVALFIIPTSIFTFFVKMTSAPTSFVWLNVISCS